MKNESDVKEWVRYANMDVLSANHLNEIQYPKPLEIICYHCQQAAEKMLKALLLKIRYPQELNIKEYHVVKALSDMKTIYDFVTNKINELQAPCNRGIE